MSFLYLKNPPLHPIEEMLHLMQIFLKHNKYNVGKYLTGNVVMLKEVSWGAQPELSSQFKTSEFERDATLISDSMIDVLLFCTIEVRISP